MNKNYYKLYKEELEKISGSKEKPSLLLHVCCAPCASAVLEKLKDIFNITIFFYNPNISPESEYNFRLDELKKLLELMNLSDIKVVATGGLGEIIAKEVKAISTVDRTLTLDGLKYIYELNK